MISLWSTLPRPKTTTYHISQCMTKPTKWHVRPAKTQISLGICPVWSVFAVCMKKAWVLSYPSSAQRRLIRLGQCPGWPESSLGAHAILLVLSCTGLYAVKLQWLKHWCLVHCGWFKLGFESLGNYSDSSYKYLGKFSYNKMNFVSTH